MKVSVFRILTVTSKDQEDESFAFEGPVAEDTRTWPNRKRLICGISNLTRLDRIGTATFERALGFAPPFNKLDQSRRTIDNSGAGTVNHNKARRELANDSPGINRFVNNLLFKNCVEYDSVGGPTSKADTASAAVDDDSGPEATFQRGTLPFEVSEASFSANFKNSCLVKSAWIHFGFV